MLDPAAGHLNPVGGKDPGAKPLVFEGQAQVDALWAFADWQLEDVGGRSGAVRPHPAPFQLEQRCFFLGAGEGDSEVIILVGGSTESRAGQSTAQDVGDAAAVDGFA